MKVLFIGGTGNLSADCARLLHTRGHDVLVLTRGRNQVPAEYRSLVADRHDPRAMQSLIETARPDVVLDFIAFDVPDVELDYRICRGFVSQYIFISSATVYARPAPRLPYTEASPLGNAFWDYAQKKLACEDWLRERIKTAGFPATIVRPAHTYSRRWVPNAVSSSTYTIAARLEAGKPVFVPDHGENPWTLTAACDFAVGLAGLVGNPNAIGEAFHITGDEVLTWNRIYSEIAEAVGASRPDIVKIPTGFICQHAPQLTGNLQGDKAHPGVYDNSKVKSLVPDFTSTKPFRVGIRESVAWLRQHPDQKNLNPQLDATVETVINAWRNHRHP